MEWKNILSNITINSDGTQGPKLSSFEEETLDIVTMSSFRRLQDKAQVFPLESGDFVRTRLTHSIEAMIVANLLGQKVSDSLIELAYEEALDKNKPIIFDKVKEYYNKERLYSTIPQILESAALLHDMGNPPFGHIGEDIISNWFKDNLKKMWIRDGKLDSITFSEPEKNPEKYKTLHDILQPNMRDSLCNFEGNAQLLRILSKLNSNQKTYSATVLSTCMKYVRPSNQKKSKQCYIGEKKVGYYSSEENYVNGIRSVTQTGNKRNPLAFLLEAADDISYLISDIEDAIKKSLIDIDTFILGLRQLYERNKSNEVMKDIAAFLLSMPKKGTNINETKLSVLKRKIRVVLIENVADVFMDNIDPIMDGTYSGELLDDDRVCKLTQFLRKQLKTKVYFSKYVSTQKARVHKILNTLLNYYVPASFYCLNTSSQKSDNVNQMICELFSPNYKQICKDKIESISKTAVGKNKNKQRFNEKVFACLQLAVDEISGMTDLYATHMYEIVNATKEE